MDTETLQAYRQERLRAAIAKLCGGNESEFGRRMGLKDGAFVRQMLAGKRPITEKTVAKVESLPGLKGWFSPSGKVLQPEVSQAATTIQGNAVRTGTLRVAGSVAIALLEAEESAGIAGTDAGFKASVSTMVMNESWLRRMADFDRPEDLALMTARGDSMQPTFEDGDVLLVNRGVADVSEEGVYVMQLDSDRFVRRVQRQFDGSLLMISDNSRLPPQAVPREERSRFTVLGRVVMAWNARRL